MPWVSISLEPSMPQVHFGYGGQLQQVWQAVHGDEKALRLFFANFASSRRHWRPYQSVWHGICYTPHALDTFYCHVLTDEDGFDWRPMEDSLCYKQARDGNHLLTSFQCDLCWFRNLQHRDPP
jgi:hypothetical protein